MKPAILPQPTASAFADYLEIRQKNVLQRWGKKVSKDQRIPSTTSVNTVELVDHLPEVLNELYKLLRYQQDPEMNEELEINAEIHGLQRWSQGYSLKDVLLELEKLRKVLLIDLMDEFKSKTPDINYEELRQIEHSAYDFFRELIISSASEYSKAHEEELREYSQSLSKTNNELDIANRKLKIEESKSLKLSLTDPLTKIANRRHLDSRLEEEIERSKRYGLPLTVIMLDLDYFKKVNDKHGHDTGDRVLIHVASCIEEHCRSIDLAARYGGEEFVIVLTDTKVDDAKALVERISKAISAKIIEPFTNEVTASFGLVQWVEGENMTELMARVDKAMYSAKQAGRNCLWIDGEQQ